MDYDRFNYFFGMDSWTASVTSALQNYYLLENSSIASYILPRNSSGQIPDVAVTLRYAKYINSTYTPLNFTVSDKDLGIFGYDSEYLKVWVRYVSDIQLYFNISTVEIEDLAVSNSYNFTVILSYTIEQCSMIKSDLNMIEDTTNLVIRKWITGSWISIIEIMVAFISLVLSWKYIYDFFTLFNRIKEKHKVGSKRTHKNIKETLTLIYSKNKVYQDYATMRRGTITDTELELNEIEAIKEPKIIKSKWDSISGKEKRNLFNWWNIVSIFGNTLQISASILYLANRNQNYNAIKLLFGIGCMITWVNITRYFKYSPTYFVIYKTLERSLPLVIKYMVGILPIYIGCALLGASLFWKSGRFENFGRSLYTLFAIINGDMIFDTYHDLSSIMTFIGQLYVYAFCFLFI
jgi:hypothetical protein